MIPTHSRRRFLQNSLAATAGLGLTSVSSRAADEKKQRDFKISVAGWSLHREVFNKGVKQIELFAPVKDRLGIKGFELVNTMLEVPTADYIRRLRREAEKNDIRILLIMVDGEGSLGAPDPDARKRAVRNHEKWIYAAADLGCHSIRVNWRGEPKGIESDPAKVQEHIKRSAETYRELVQFGQDHGGINVIIENHGGWSSDPKYLVPLMKEVNLPGFGTLPDFGNFYNVDRYEAVDAMMPYAKAVSAKCYDFGEDGKETKIDYARMIEIVCDKHNYTGWIGIEFEGGRLGEWEGIAACSDLLMKLKQA